MSKVVLLMTGFLLSIITLHSDKVDARNLTSKTSAPEVQGSGLDKTKTQGENYNPNSTGATKKTWWIGRIGVQKTLAFSQSSDISVQTSVPLSIGYRQDKLTLGTEFFWQTLSEEGNSSLGVSSTLRVYNLFSELYLYELGSLSFFAGLSAGVALNETRTTLFGESNTMRSGYFSYTKTYLSAALSLKPNSAMLLSVITQHSSLLSPHSQLGLLYSLEFRF